MQALFARCDPEAYLTLTAIHPTGNRPVPSRHIRLGDAAAMSSALERLHAANAMGWGAYFGLATRRSGLSRWQRGDITALVEIPAIIADTDEAPDVVLARITAFPLPPSLIISSGHGVHVYWVLEEPTRDFQAVNTIHRNIAGALKGDYLTAATALRLPGSCNTKRSGSTKCEILQCDWSIRYEMQDFADYEVLLERRMRSRFRQPCVVSTDAHDIDQITAALLHQGFKWRNTWLNGPCPNANQHKHGDRRPSFGVNTATGYGYCFVCGTFRVQEIYSMMK